MEWIGAGVLATIAFAMMGTLLWVSWDETESAGRWWVASGVVMASSGIVTVSGHPAFLFPFSSGHLTAPFAAWFLYRGVTEYSRQPPRFWAVAVAVVATLGWLAAYGSGEPRWLFYASAGGTLPLLASSTLMLFRVASTPLSRAFAASTIAPIPLIALHESFLSAGLPHGVEIRIWLAALSGVCLLASCAILERRMAESNHALRQSAEQLRLGALISGMGTWTVDRHSGAVEWSEEMFPIYGMTPDMPVPVGEDQLALLAEEDREPFRRAVDAAYEEDVDLDQEFRIEIPGREPRYGRSRAQFIRAPGGRRILVGTTVDVTAHREALEELRRHRHHLEDLVEQRTAELADSQRRLHHSERLASIGTLTAGLAHQVNNPMGAILAAAGFAKRCRNDAEELETLRRAVDDIEREAKRCGEIVRDMLRFASDRPTDKKLVPIDPVLERIRGSLRHLEQRYDATISVKTDGPTPIVEASTIELEQAITNLVENAVQSREKGVRVEISRSTVGDEVRIQIRDDGPGISSEDLDRVFDPFYTSRLESGGTGLGLSVAHGIAREHGGSLRLDSELDEGTTALFSLPVAG